MEKPSFDLIVAGAGPAGSACAIVAARAGVKVLVLEKDSFPRHKVCGEFVSPESLHLLEWLLGGKHFQDRPEINRARIFSERTTISLPIAPSARSIPRFDLDAALLDAAQQAGAQTRERTTILGIDQGPVFTIKTTEGTFTARAAVNASGRWSQLTQYAAAKEDKKWIGLKGHFYEANPSLSVDLYFFTGGYCGVQPVSANVVNACAMVRADAARSLQEVFSRQRDLWQRSRDWDPAFATVTTSSLYFRPPQTQANGMLLAGDAAAFIDPFAGDGISLALHTGALAGASLAPFIQGKCSLEQAGQNYHAAYLKQFAPAFRGAARVRRVLSAPPAVRSVFLRIASLKPFARALVHSTRTRGSQPL